VVTTKILECSLEYYCHMLPGNVMNNLWVLDLISRFIGYSPGGIMINYNTPNITHTSGLLITHQFFSHYHYHSTLLVWKTDSLSGADLLWKWLGNWLPVTSYSLHVIRTENSALLLEYQIIA
jgi:hypothetical protein